jgi:hypothetical protein
VEVSQIIKEGAMRRVLLSAFVLALVGTVTGCGTATVTPTPLTGQAGPSGGSPQALAALSAWVPNGSPHQHSTVIAKALCVSTSSGLVISGVPVTFTWHFKTGKKTNVAATNESGMATCARDIGAAAKGYHVSITVVAKYQGDTIKVTTGFTPS